MSDYLMETYNRKPVSFVRGEGVYLWDNNGKKYIDALCGLAVTSLGHSNELISNVLSLQSKTLIHTSNAFQIDMQKNLAARLCKLSGMTNAFFCNSGAESVETAIKIARKYGNDQNISTPKILVMENSFHGRTLAALSATSSKKSHEGFTPLVEGFVRAPFDSVEKIELALHNHEDIVALLTEPIQGEGGIKIPKPGYLKKLRDICNDKNLLFMVDEVQSGFCRTGKWFGYQHDHITPDVVMVAKALGNGVPIGACLASGKASNLLKPGSHGSTFGGNPLASAIGKRSLELLYEDNLIENSRIMGDYFKQSLLNLNSKIIKEVRGKGLWLGVEIDPKYISGKDLSLMCLDHGILCKETHETTIRYAPPLIITEEELSWGIDKISTVLKKVEKVAA